MCCVLKAKYLEQLNVSNRIKEKIETLTVTCERKQKHLKGKVGVLFKEIINYGVVLIELIIIFFIFLTF